MERGRSLQGSTFRTFNVGSMLEFSRNNVNINEFLSDFK